MYSALQVRFYLSFSFSSKLFPRDSKTIVFFLFVWLVEGNHVGSVQSQLLCRSILDLYIGEEPFDKNAREDFLDNAASLAFDN